MRDSRSTQTFPERLAAHKRVGRCPYQNVHHGKRELCENKAGEDGFCTEHQLDLSDAEHPKGKVCEIGWCKKQAVISTFYGFPDKGEHPKCDMHAGQYG